MSEKRTEIKAFGEFRLIEHLTSSFKPGNPGTRLGIGDDAAVIEAGDKYFLSSSDFLIENIHFDLTYFPLQHLGYKAVAVNVSDIAAMNGIPRQILVNLAISNRFSVESLEVLYQGIKAACDNYKVDLAGGDTTSSPTGLSLCITAIGEADKKDITTRANAREHEIVCATGDLGGAYLGLQVLEREKEVFLSNQQMQPKLEGYDYLVKRQLKPEARMDIIYELQEMKVIPTSMIDISDGLASDILQLSKASKKGFRIFEEQLPIDKKTYETAVEFKLDPTTCVLNGGEDYELLFTIRQDDYEKLKGHPDIHFIGHVQKLEEGNQLITKSGNPVTLKAQGWQNFQ